MHRRLPPLNALRAFEAAARHQSLTKAADELGVTPGAVGHQVKALEAFFGVPLFKRRHRALRLTDAGQAYLPGLHAGLNQLAEATRALEREMRGGVLTVSASPCFAVAWLLPRLEGFRERHPAIELRLDASARAVDFEREDIDLEIRYGEEDCSGLRSDRLFGERIFPVCSPGLCAGPDGLRRPQDLAGHVLLHVRDWVPRGGVWAAWPAWLRIAGVAGLAVRDGPVFSSIARALEAAVRGEGLALGSAVDVADHLTAGTLVRPFDAALVVNFAHFLVCPEGAADQPKIAAFRDWILEEAARESAGLDLSSAHGSYGRPFAAGSATSRLDRPDQLP
ncbi:MAG: transcriptional regulator GcvA [Kiloniellales bacterium]|nr:transcriptional regulator GcvA [Kiloniellales bacterium]